MADSSNRIPVVVAVIGVVGTLGAALIGIWGKDGCAHLWEHDAGTDARIDAGTLDAGVDAGTAAGEPPKKPPPPETPQQRRQRLLGELSAGTFAGTIRLFGIKSSADGKYYEPAPSEHSSKWVVMPDNYEKDNKKGYWVFQDGAQPKRAWQCFERSGQLKSWHEEDGPVPRFPEGWELFWFEVDASRGVIRARSTYGGYVQLDEKGGFRCNGEQPSTAAPFHIGALSGG